MKPDFKPFRPQLWKTKDVPPKRDKPVQAEAAPVQEAADTDDGKPLAVESISAVVSIEPDNAVVVEVSSPEAAPVETPEAAVLRRIKWQTKERVRRYRQRKRLGMET